MEGWEARHFALLKTRSEEQDAQEDDEDWEETEWGHRWAKKKDEEENTLPPLCEERYFNNQKWETSLTWPNNILIIPSANTEEDDTDDKSKWQTKLCGCPGRGENAVSRRLCFKYSAAANEAFAWESSQPKTGDEPMKPVMLRNQIGIAQKRQQPKPSPKKRMPVTHQTADANLQTNAFVNGLHKVSRGSQRIDQKTLKLVRRRRILWRSQKSLKRKMAPSRRQKTNYLLATTSRRKYTILYFRHKRTNPIETS